MEIFFQQPEEENKRQSIERPRPRSKRPEVITNVIQLNPNYAEGKDTIQSGRKPLVRLIGQMKSRTPIGHFAPLVIIKGVINTVPNHQAVLQGSAT
jgi:hypothetical protein